MLQKEFCTKMIVPTLGTPCGIAEYSKSLSDNIPNCTISDGKDIDSERADIYHIHYHPAFYDFAERAVEILKGKKIVMTFHNIMLIERFLDRIDIAILQKPSKIESNKIKIIPLAIQKTKQTKGWALNDIAANRPLITTFGFLLRYKNIKELIIAINKLQKKYFGINLIVMCAIHPQYRVECELYLKECKEKAEYLKVPVHFWTDFYKGGTINAIFRISDLIVLPHSSNNEEASASVNSCLGTGKITLITDAKQFENVPKSICPRAKIDSDSLAENIDFCLNKEVKEKYEKRIQEYIALNSFENIAQKHTEVYKGLLQ